MSRFWRRITPAVVTAGLVATAGAIPAEAASASTYGVTISATSPNYPGASHGKVDGYALAVYKETYRNYDVATVSGGVTGAQIDDVATLLAEPFGTTSFTATASVTLNPTGTGATPYSFAVKPSVATRYEVQVTTGTTVDATSSVQTVYVTEWTGGGKFVTKCSHGRCTSTWKYYEELPPSARGTEMAKRQYLYFTLDTKLPKFPRYIGLARSAAISKARKLAADEFYITLRYSYSTHLRNPNRDVLYLICSKDSESKDGLGLPGHHGCGLRRIRTVAPYWG
jgi:hypothetical protein